MPTALKVQASLGGNSKTVMLAAISPAASNVEETVSTLRYARCRPTMQSLVLTFHVTSSRLVMPHQLSSARTASALSMVATKYSTYMPDE